MFKNRGQQNCAAIVIPRDHDDSFDDNSDGISDDDGDIYIMMKCLCDTRRLLGLAGQRPALA